MRILLTSLSIAAAIGLSGCGSMEPSTTGAVGGAALGGVAGSAITGGSTLGTVGGAVAGGIVGHEVGDRYEERHGGRR